MRKTVNWDKFEDEEVPSTQPALGPETLREAPKKKGPIILYKFTEREKAQAYNKWERMGNRIATKIDQDRFQEYVKKEEAKVAARRANPELPYVPTMQQPTPIRAVSAPWIAKPELITAQAISSDGLFAEPSTPLLQLLGQKIISFREELAQAEHAEGSPTHQSGLL